MSKKNVSRRDFVKATAFGGGAIIFGACAPQATPAAPAAPAAPVEVEVEVTRIVEVAEPTALPGFDWKKYAGTSITALFTTNPQGKFMESLVPEFELATGIKVDFQIIETGAMRDKQNVEFAAQSPAIDIWHTFLPQEGQKYDRAGWYEDIAPYLANSSLMPPDYDVADLESSIRLSKINGVLVGLPMWVESQPLFYNQELLDKAKLAIPTTMDELEAAAKAIHAPKQEIYGWATRATSPLNTSAFLPALLSFGGNWLDADGRAAINSPEAVKAVDWYARMLRQYGPPSPETVDIARWSDLFKAGKVGLAVDSPSFLGPFSDKASSAIVGKFGISSWPAGPAGSRNSLWCWSITMGKFSEKKEAAWYYMLWHTMKERVMRISGTGVMPSRDSVTISKGWTPLLPNLPTFRADALENGIVDAFPQVTVVAEARQVLGDAIVKAIQGEDVQATLDEANGLFQELIDSQA